MEDSKIINITTEGDIAFVSFLKPNVSAVSDVEIMASDLRAFIADSRPKNLVIDFTGLKFFSSQVLGLLVDIWKRLKEFQAKMVICGINPDLSRVFKITNLDSLFEFYPDKQSAVEALGE
jgi:anti-sigma B factor antagonist